MPAGRTFWIIVWYGILLLGVLGFGASIYWGRETRWKNIDELLRAIGTTLVSVGMLLLLYGVGRRLGELLLVVALVCFVLAFVFGRRITPVPGAEPPEPTYDDPPRKAS